MADETASAVQAILDEMPRKLNRQATTGVDVVVQLNLTGNGGGKFYLSVRKEALTVTRGTYARPNLTMTVSATDYVALCRGKLNGQVAFMNGKLKMQGDMGVAMKLPSFFEQP